jgi:hypothetical protein
MVIELEDRILLGRYVCTYVPTEKITWEGLGLRNSTFRIEEIAEEDQRKIS